MKQVSEKKSGGGDPLQFNQLVRWVNTKEDHCSKLITRMSEYGLCQRCKHFSDPTSPFKDETEYLQAITAHHLVMVAAMKVRKRERKTAAAPRGPARRGLTVRTPRSASRTSTRASRTSWTTPSATWPRCTPR